jgi:hypothetical protein
MDIRNTTLDDIAAVIGFSATLRLAAWFGDAGNMYVPEHVGEGQVLTRLIGLPAAARLSREFGGEHLALPRLRSYEDDLKRRIVGRMLEQNFSSREIAVHMRLSERRVQQIARELESVGLIDVVLPKKPQQKEPMKKQGHWDGLTGKE